LLFPSPRIGEAAPKERVRTVSRALKFPPLLPLRLAADEFRVVARDEASIGLIFQLSFTVILATRKLSLKKAAAITNFALRAGNVGI
jgi:hypothetical protein